MRSFEDGINYQKIGYFLVSEKKILGPRFYFENDGSKLFKIITALVKRQKYNKIEELLGIKLGQDVVTIRKRTKTISLEQDKVSSFKTTYIDKERGYKIDLELYDKWKHYSSTSTLVLLSNSYVHDGITMHYYEKNLFFETKIDKIPKHFLEGVLNGNLYQSFFEKLGFDQDKIKIDMNHDTWYNVVLIKISGEYDRIKVNTVARLDIYPDSSELRFVAWPFEEGVYAFTMDPDNIVPVTTRSIKDIRKKVKKVSKLFGMPKGIKVPKDWKIEYNHSSYTLSYQSPDGESEIVFSKNSKEVCLRYRGMTKCIDKSESTTVLETFFDNPEIVVLL